MTKALLALMLATAFAGIGIHLGSARFSWHNQNAIPVAAPAATSGSFTHPLVFPPVDANGNISISIDEGCIQILDGPCTNMWTYRRAHTRDLTFADLPASRPDVTFTNNLDADRRGDDGAQPW